MPLQTGIAPIIVCRFWGRLFFGIAGVVNIRVPIRGVLVDVFRNRVPFVFIADDVVVVIALPNRRALTAMQFVDLFGHGRFVRADDCTD